MNNPQKSFKSKNLICEIYSKSTESAIQNQKEITKDRTRKSAAAALG